MKFHGHQNHCIVRAGIEGEPSDVVVVGDVVSDVVADVVVGVVAGHKCL